jgi:hypothetical protein
MDKKQCAKCKTTDGKFVRFSKSVSGKEYFHCRKCNADRCRRYRATPNGAMKCREAVYRSWEREPEKQAARLLLNASVRKGLIARPDRCSKCGEVKKVEGHHRDYSHPLEVEWVCRGCHADIERKS